MFKTIDLYVDSTKHLCISDQPESGLRPNPYILVTYGICIKEADNLEDVSNIYIAVLKFV